MTQNNKHTHKQENADGATKAGKELSIEDRLRATAERLLAAVNPDAPRDESTQSLVKETLARALHAEDNLARSASRLDWLESMNIHDEVTGQLNRRGFLGSLRRGLARARRYGETGALLLVDVVRHEEIVETRGAGGGDYVLTAIANILQRRFRDVDNIARLESGRFAVQLLMISQEDARRRAAMLKGHLNELEIPWQGENIAIQVRIGLVLYGQGDEADDLLERAEAELEERQRRIAHMRHPA